MKMTKKQIDLIIVNTPQELKGTQPHLDKKLGAFTTTQTNWSYNANFTKYNNANILVITRFGVVI